MCLEASHETKLPGRGSKREADFCGGGRGQATRGRDLDLPGGWAGRPEAGQGGSLPLSTVQVPLSCHFAATTLCIMLWGLV